MKAFIFAFLLGAFATLGMAPYNFFPAIFSGLSGLFLIVHKIETPLRATWVSYFFFFGYFLFGLSWIANALLVKDNPYWWAWPLGLVVLQAVIAYSIWLSAYAYKYVCMKFVKKHKLFFEYLLFCLAVIFSEYLRSWAFTGLPWNMFGYTWISVPEIAQVAGISDIFLLTSLTVLWATAPAYIYLCRHKTIATCVLIVSITCSYGYGYSVIQSYKNSHPDTQNEYSYTIVQPNIAQEDKINYNKVPEGFIRHIEKSFYNAENFKHSYKAYYIVWPESAVPLNYLETEHAKNVIRNVLSQYPAPAYIIAGSARYVRDTDQYFNSIVTIDKNANVIDTYDKRHLVPFGEYMPYADIINVLPFVGFKGFTKGKETVVHESPEGMRFLPLICYEIIFPKYAKVAKNSDTDVIINVTNDAWYGDSAGPYQHLVQVRFRAIESHTTILRSANTGISAIINPIGQLIYSSDLFVSEQIITSN